MMVAIVIVSAVILSVAYRLYGGALSRWLQLDDQRVTPAIALRDDVDYAPLDRSPLLSQHFSAIAAAGPIVGPILAGAMFGWLPALLWILVGAIFVGGVHDMTALVASIRHKARSIAEVVRDSMSLRAYLLFLAFVWLALVYIIIAFTDVTAAAFIGRQTLENGEVVSGGGIASSSLMYLALPILMGLLVRYGKVSMGWATLLFLPLVGLSIFAGQKIPFDVVALVQQAQPQLDPAEAARTARVIWDVALLIYCAVASVVPMWLLLQPRGQLGGYFLFAALGAGGLGLLLGGQPIQLPAFRGWTSPVDNEPLLPMLFITIACGACSGFHALIASGTTSKQLQKETDARPIGYGSMLLEAMVAILSLCCVMLLPASSPLVAKPEPNLIYALGIGTFLKTLHIPQQLAVSFALMAFTTFVYDTLDVCSRLGRYVIQELLGMHNRTGAWIGTILTSGVPLFFVTRTMLDKPGGSPIPLWKAFWKLFGASNQLLAALTLLGITIWLWQTRRAWWTLIAVGIPTVVMYVMSSWALIRIIRVNFAGGITADPVPWIAVLLVVLATLLLVEAVLVLLRVMNSGPPAPKAASTVLPVSAG